MQMRAARKRLKSRWKRKEEQSGGNRLQKCIPEPWATQQRTLMTPNYVVINRGEKERDKSDIEYTRSAIRMRKWKSRQGYEVLATLFFSILAYEVGWPV